MAGFNVTVTIMWPSPVARDAEQENNMQPGAIPDSLFAR